MPRWERRLGASCVALKRNRGSIRWLLCSRATLRDPLLDPFARECPSERYRTGGSAGATTDLAARNLPADLDDHARAGAAGRIAINKREAISPTCRAVELEIPRPHSGREYTAEFRALLIGDLKCERDLCRRADPPGP